MLHDVSLFTTYTPPHREGAIPLPDGEAALVQALLACQLAPGRAADCLRLDADRTIPTSTPVGKALARRRRNIRWIWDAGGPSRTFLDMCKHVSYLGRYTWSGTAADLLAAVRDVPFLWMSTASVHDTWGGSGLPVEYSEGPGFADGHYRQNWVAAFRGDLGHRQLVSRRWLRFQPWRLVRDEERDVSMVEYHDTTCDPLTALEQARPGHKRMGIGNDGGFIQSCDFPYWYPDLRKLYDPGRRQLVRVVPPGQSVDPREMLEACAHRRYQPLEKPVDSVAYVFMLERDARRHLHEMWLRELEVRAIVDGREVRLDDRYEPPPHVPPSWVDGHAPGASAVTTEQPLFDRSHDHRTVGALTLSEGRGYHPKEAPPEVAALVADLETLHPALHERADRLHDALGGTAEHDAAPPAAAAALAAFRELICRAYGTAIVRRREPGAAAALRAMLGEIRATLA